MAWIDKRDEQILLNEVNQTLKKKKQPNVNDALVGKRLTDIYSRHPYLPTGIALSLAEGNAPMDMVDQIAQRATIEKYKKVSTEAEQPKVPSAESKDPDNAWYNQGIFGVGKTIREKVTDGVFSAAKFVLGNTIGRVDAIKTGSRYVTATGESAVQHLQNYAARVTDPNRPTSDTENAFASTSLGALLQNPDLAGDGFFVRGKAEEIRAEKARKYRWQLANGDTYTVGRGTANMFFTPGSKPYWFISGVIDAALTWYGDPTNKPVDYVFKAKKAKQILPFMETADEASAARQLALGEAGVIGKAEEKAIETSKFFNWLDNSGPGKRVVQRTAEETNELKILEAYNYRITPEQARKLAQTTDPKQVRGIIAESAIRLSDETAGRIPFATSADQLPISGFSYGLTEKIPGYNHIKNNRWLAKTPTNNLVVNGTPKQKADGIKNIKNWLQSINVDPYSGEGQKLMEKAFDWAGADGTRADANKVVNLFLGNKAEKIEGILPIALKNEGVDPKIVDQITSTLRDNEKLIRQYSFNAAGKADDHGMMTYLSRFMKDDELKGMLSELFPTRITDDMTRQQLDAFVRNLEPGEITMMGPTSLAQMLNNVVVLPDPQMIRRLMNNQFFRRGKKAEQATVARVAEWAQNEVWRPWALATIGFIMRNGFDAQTRIAISGIARNNPWDYLMIAADQKGVGTIMGDTWKSAEAIPERVLKKVAKSESIQEIQGLIDEYVGINSSIPDEILDDLVGTTDAREVSMILDRIRPDLEYMEDYVDGTRSYSKYMVEDPRNQITQLVEDGQFDLLDASDKAFPLAIIDQAGFINSDPLQRMAARMSHLPEDKQIDILEKWLASDTREARIAKRTMIDTISAPLVGDANNGQNRIVAGITGAAGMTDRQLVEAWYSNNATEQVALFTQGTDELRAFAGYNSVPVAPSQMVDQETVLGLNKGVEPKVGDFLTEPTEIIRNGEVIQGVKTHLVLERHIRKVNGAKVKTYKLIEVVDPNAAFGRSRAFDQTTFSPRAERFVRDLVAKSAENKKMGLDPLVPERALYRKVTPQEPGKDITSKITAFPRWFFRVAVDPFSKTFERSPAWRRMYYNNIADNAQLLAPEEANRLIEIIDDAARKAFPKRYEKDAIGAMEDYIGGKPVLDAINRAAIAEGSGAFGTVEQLQEYASTLARVDFEDLFFNTVERSNFTDAMKVAAPFGAAWAEIAGTYARAVVENPARLRKAQLVFRGAEDFDPDNDGRGFVWTDPMSKVQMFAFPLSGLITRAITAATGQQLPETFLAAPTQRLSAGFSFIPSLGPIYQIAVTELFNAANVPDTDDIRKLILPYGDAQVTDLIPGTWMKAIEALDADPSKLNTVYGNTYQDVFAHLASTGEYDLSDASDVTRLDQDARAAARGVTVVRAISQFVGPTAATPQYRFKKEAGEYHYVNEMVRAFSDFQNENYDTAVQNFVKAFGENAMIYLSGKTKIDEAYKGVEANEAYGRWERDNQDLIAGFKQSAPFLAPGGFGEFSMEVYSRQLAAGVRKDRDNRDRLADAQRRIGSALYKNIRNQYPETLSDAQRQKLRQYRAQIHRQYPGFPETVEFEVGEFENFISDLGRLVQDPRTEGNRTADSIYEYLKYRTNVLTSLKNQFGVSIKAEKNSGARDARGLLYAKGEELATVNPDFRRIWEQELSAEVE